MQHPLFALCKALEFLFPAVKPALRFQQRGEKPIFSGQRAVGREEKVDRLFISDEHAGLKFLRKREDKIRERLRLPPVQPVGLPFAEKAVRHLSRRRIGKPRDAAEEIRAQPAARIAREIPAERFFAQGNLLLRGREFVAHADDQRALIRLVKRI